MTKVEVMSSCLVGKSNAVSSISKLELFPWDLRLLQIGPIQRGLIFYKPPSQKTLIQHLKNSLSRTLDFFPPLAGRLATTAHRGAAATFFVDCNNAGAQLTHAVAADVSVSDLIEPEYTPEIVSSLFPFNGVTNFEGISKPLLAVQVTELADGVFIACAANHAVVDGTSFWHFFNSWSEISRGFDSISKSPVFDRCVFADDKRRIHLPTLEENLYVPSMKLPQKVFHFRKEILGKLKAEANSEAGTDRISTLQAVVAHLWRSTIRCGGGRTQIAIDDDASSRETLIMMAIGVRERMPSLPVEYFGNASYSAAMAISEIDLLQRGLGSAALKINELISQQTSEAIRRNAEKVEVLKLGLVAAPLPRRLIIASSPRHDVYGCDFGWGKPIGVRSGKLQKVEGLVVVLPAAEGGGIDLEVCLAEETLQAMENDAEFTAAFST